MMNKIVVLLFTVLLVSSCTASNVDNKLNPQIIDSDTSIDSDISSIQNVSDFFGETPKKNLSSNKSTIQNVSDPFGKTPKGISPNCGPEHRYEFDIEINSKEDFIDFIETYDNLIFDNYGNVLIELDDFRVNYKENNWNDNYYKNLKSSEIDWNAVSEATVIEKVGSRTVYMLDYNPFMCRGYTLKATNDGYVSVYGCCGI